MELLGEEELYRYCRLIPGMRNCLMLPRKACETSLIDGKLQNILDLDHRDALFKPTSLEERIPAYYLHTNYITYTDIKRVPCASHHNARRRHDI